MIIKSRPITIHLAKYITIGCLGITPAFATVTSEALYYREVNSVYFANDFESNTLANGAVASKALLSSDYQLSANSETLIGHKNRALAHAFESIEGGFSRAQATSTWNDTWTILGATNSPDQMIVHLTLTGELDSPAPPGSDIEGSWFTYTFTGTDTVTSEPAVEFGIDQSQVANPAIFNVNLNLPVFFTYNQPFEITSHLVATANAFITSSGTFDVPDSRANLGNSVTLDFIELPEGAAFISESGHEYRFAPVPIPTAFWLFASALTGFSGMRKLSFLRKP